MLSWIKDAGRWAYGMGREYVTSKKAVALIAGVVVIVAGKVGLDLNADEVTKIVALLASYIVGQGIADNNKSATKLLHEAVSTEAVTAANKRKLAALLNAAQPPER